MSINSKRRQMTLKPYLVRMRSELKDLGSGIITFYGWPISLPDTPENKEQIQIARSRVVINNDVFLADPVVFARKNLVELRKLK